MISDTTGMVGGETVIQTGTGNYQGVRYSNTFQNGLC